MSNKQVALKLQKAMKDLGYKVSIGHSYEILSKLSGEKSWNVAKSKGTDFEGTFVKRSSQKDPDYWKKALDLATENPTNHTIDVLCLFVPSPKEAGKVILKFAKTLNDELLMRLVRGLHERSDWASAFLDDEDFHARLNTISKHL